MKLKQAGLLMLCLLALAAGVLLLSVYLPVYMIHEGMERIKDRYCDFLDVVAEMEP